MLSKACGRIVVIVFYQALTIILFFCNFRELARACNVCRLAKYISFHSADIYSVSETAKLCVHNSVEVFTTGVSRFC